MSDKNSYSIKNNAVRISTNNTKDKDVGYIILSASGSDIIIKSCHEKACSNKMNRETSTVNIE